MKLLYWDIYIYSRRNYETVLTNII
jgi:hypothetical protein